MYCWHLIWTDILQTLHLTPREIGAEETIKKKQQVNVLSINRVYSWDSGPGYVTCALGYVWSDYDGNPLPSPIVNTITPHSLTEYITPYILEVLSTTMT